MNQIEVCIQNLKFKHRMCWGAWCRACFCCAHICVRTCAYNGRCFFATAFCLLQCGRGAGRVGKDDALKEIPRGYGRPLSHTPFNRVIMTHESVQLPTRSAIHSHTSEPTICPCQTLSVSHSPAPTLSQDLFFVPYTVRTTLTPSSGDGTASLSSSDVLLRLLVSVGSVEGKSVDTHQVWDICQGRRHLTSEQL